MKVALPLFAAAACASGSAQADRAKASGAPVVLELFTSQGCSSCPPAEALFTKLASDGALEGRPILPLALHVDYWNDGGWIDPYSQAAFGGRQMAYGAAMRGTTDVYTPQAIVAGAAELNGADEDGLARAVAAAPAQVAIDAHATRDDKGLHVTATAPKDASVWIVVWEDGLATDVRRGENAGRRMVADHVVRALQFGVRRGTHGTVDVPLDPSWKRIGAAAFAQNKDTLAITGATVLSL
jgi:hypothetical protein